MASPQLENGFTRIANETLEQLSSVQMSGTEWQFVMCLFRKTYGFNKSEDWITGSQIVAMTGLKKERVSEAKKRLMGRKIVTEKRNKISFNKDYEQWVELRKSVTGVTEKRNKVLRKSVNTIDNKETITKDTSEEALREKVVDNFSTPLVENVRVVGMADFNPLGAEVIFELINIDPKNKTYYGNKTQRAACDFLIEEYGLQETKNRILIINKTNGVPFFPTITTPVQLRDKWVPLEKAIERHKRESKTKSVAF